MANIKRDRRAAYFSLLLGIFASTVAHAEQPPLCKGSPVTTEAVFRDSDGSLVTREYIAQSVGGQGIYKFTESGAPVFSTLSLCGLFRTGSFNQPFAANANSPYEDTSQVAFPLLVGTTAATIRRDKAGTVLDGVDWLVTREIPPTDVLAAIPILPGRVMEVKKSVEGKPDEVLWWSVTLRTPVRWRAKNGYTTLVSFKAVSKGEPLSDKDGESGGLVDVPSQ
jgi:hypothetical protein